MWYDLNRFQCRSNHKPSKCMGTPHWLTVRSYVQNKMNSKINIWTVFNGNRVKAELYLSAIVLNQQICQAISCQCLVLQMEAAEPGCSIIVVLIRTITMVEIWPSTVRPFWIPVSFPGVYGTMNFSSYFISVSWTEVRMTPTECRKSSRNLSPTVISSSDLFFPTLRMLKLSVICSIIEKG